MTKTFTLEEANHSLVFVALVLRDIQKIWQELMNKEQHEERSEAWIRTQLDRLKCCNEELAQVGCILKDPMEGTLNFPTFYKNEPVFFAWKLGEEQVEYWHGIGEKFQNRKPINNGFISQNSKAPLSDLNPA